MQGLEFLIPIFGILLILVPVTGITLTLTMRFALKPFVETLAHALKDAGFTSSTEAHLQIQDLTEQVEALAGELHRLQVAQDFDRKLKAPQEPPEASTP